MNASPSDVVVVSETFARAVRAALAAARATDGLVDPTLGAALVAAGYDRDFELLGADARPTGRPVPGTWRSVSLTGRLLSRRGALLDLNGVVKSLVVDEALRLLPERSFVSAGGDLATGRRGRRRASRAAAPYGSSREVSPRAARRGGAGCAAASSSIT